MASRAVKARPGRPTLQGYDNQGHAGEQEARHRGPASVSSRGSITSEKSSDFPGPDNNNQKVGLKKEVGLTSGVALIVGTMIGSGIFISPKGVAEGAGSVGFSLVCWVICGVISTLGAISYAELGTFIPKSGGEYPYLLDCFGPLHATVGGIPAFLFAWINMVVIRPSAIAIILLAFAKYILEPFYTDCISDDVAEKCLASFAILLLLLINCFSVKLATRVQNVFAAIKIVSLVIIILGGFVMMAMGHTETLATGFEGTNTNIGQIAIGLYNGMWAYDGWNNLNYVTEEIQNPNRNLPLSIAIGIPLVTLLYTLVNISYFTVMSMPELLRSTAVAVTWGRRTLGIMWWIVPFSVACSTFGAANGTFFSGSRLTYVAAREGHMVEILSMIHVKRNTPLPSLVFTCIVALIMVIPGNIGSLIDFFSFAVWLFYGLTMVALLVMRYTKRNEERPIKVPIVIPIIVLIVSLYLVVAPIIDDPRIEFLFAALFILLGLVFYVPFVLYQKVIPGMGKLTTFLQLLMEVSPASDESEL